ncbi:cuticle protein 7-like [Anopheles maculipalpis]|uniref:cuticle protein 7-like n=1 Tax=Anopheles maculipalpis TaxID=1496333 RepID=UPI002158C560|nr:cuticle protein 7-like [Anopheles maculipalpis]
MKIIMQDKLSILLLCTTAVVSAAILPVTHHLGDDHGPVEYRFEYSVNDDHTGDSKRQHEERHGDKVTGQYSLIDADGYRRIVDYSADKHTGFVANVHREPIKGFHMVTTPNKVKVVPVVKFVKSITLAPVLHHTEPVHHVIPVHHIKHHQIIPHIHVQNSVVYAPKHGNSVHSHTSFKSENVSYQY